MLTLYKKYFVIVLFCVLPVQKFQTVCIDDVEDYLTKWWKKNKHIEHNWQRKHLFFSVLLGVHQNKNCQLFYINLLHLKSTLKLNNLTVFLWQKGLPTTLSFSQNKNVFEKRLSDSRTSNANIHSQCPLNETKTHYWISDLNCKWFHWTIDATNPTIGVQFKISQPFRW